MSSLVDRYGLLLPGVGGGLRRAAGAFACCSMCCFPKDKPRYNSTFFLKWILTLIMKHVSFDCDLAECSLIQTQHIDDVLANHENVGNLAGFIR